jgi:hypothetical protein
MQTMEMAMRRVSLALVSRGLVGLALAGVMLEAGCAWLWVMSPRLTAIYNAEFTAGFFERLPWFSARLSWLSERLPWVGAVGPVGDAGQDVTGMMARLELGLGLMIVGYLSGLWALRSQRGTQGAGWVVVAGAVIFRLTMLLLPGLFSTDVFSYVMYGRIAGVSMQNPYVLAPNSFPGDPFLSWVFPFWRDQPSVYGPLWTDISALLARLTGSLGNFEQVMVYRALVATIEAATLGLLWWVLSWFRTADQLASWAMYAWNPLVLFDLVGGAHNDAAMVLLLLIGVGCIARPTGERTALLALTLSASIKYATGVVVPLWAMAWAAQSTSTISRAMRLGLGLVLPVVLSALLWWPWLQTSQALQPLSDAAGGRLAINSAPDLLALTLADQVLEPGGLDRETSQTVARFWTRAITRTLFGAYLAWEMWRLWRRPVAVMETVRASARVLLVLPLLVLSWVWSWYFSWSLVLAPLLGWRSRLARLVVAYTLCALPVVYAHQYLTERLSGAFVVAFALGPLLSLLWPTRESSGRQRSRSLCPRPSDSPADT